MHILYPAIKPYAIHQLAVDELHTLYVEESGNPKGLPVLFLHGGPGAGCDPEHRRFFDPTRYRIILFDQRGAGQSTPHAELKKNTTQLLVSDMEAIRSHLEVDRWVLFGGSWGSTLALVYAETHPERVLNMVLRGIFLCRQEDLDWFYKTGGANRVFPDAWEEFTNHLMPHFAQDKQTDILKHSYQCLTGEDEVARMAVAKAWSQWEANCATLQPNPSVVNHLTHPHVALSLARIESHYFINNIFLEENQILNSADRLAEIPGVIVHGRYDMVCPLDNAYALKKVWPKAELEIVREAGHSAFEPGMVHALVTATNTIAGHYSIPG